MVPLDNEWVWQNKKQSLYWSWLNTLQDKLCNNLTRGPLVLNITVKELLHNKIYTRVHLVLVCITYLGFAQNVILLVGKNFDVQKTADKIPHFSPQLLRTLCYYTLSLLTKSCHFRILLCLMSKSRAVTMQNKRSDFKRGYFFGTHFIKIIPYLVERTLQELIFCFWKEV